MRYTPWGISALSSNPHFVDPLIINADAWNFPTNKFPSIGWLGRVHRGTPWQTVYFKSDNPSNMQLSQSDWHRRLGQFS